MRILMCTPRMHIGGAETHILTLSSELVRRGHEVTVASSGGVYVDRLIKAGISHVCLPLDRTDPVSLFAARRRMRALVRKIRPDVVHAHGRIPAFVYGPAGGRRSMPPLVTTAHGMYDPSAPKGPLTVWGERTIAVSTGIRDYLQNAYGMDPSRIDFIPNGVEKIPAVRTPHEGFRMLMCCRLDPDTEGPVAAAMDAAAALRKEFPDRGISLTVAGDGASAGELVRYGAGLNGLPGNSGLISFAGAVTRPEELYAVSDLFIGCSRSAAEAMAAGLPAVLLSPAPGGSVCCGLLREGTVENSFQTNYLSAGDGSASCSLSGVVGGIIRDGGRKAGAAASYCRKFVLEHNSVSAVASQTLDAYMKTLDRSRPGIFLCGYFGASNAGDDATLASVLADIRTFAPEAPVYVSAGRDRRGLPEGVLRIGKTDLGKARCAMSGCRLFVLCGGSLLQNGTSGRSLAYYTWMTSLARRSGCRTVLLGGGLGPLRGSAAKAGTASCIAKLDAAAFRDRDSLNIAYTLTDGMNRCTFRLAADPALSTAAVPLPGGLSVPDGALAVMPRLPVSGCSRDFIAALARELNAASRKGLVPVFIPLSAGDAAICRKLNRTVPGSLTAGRMDPGQIVTYLSACRASVAVRLHGAVFSLLGGTPCLCVSYDPKVSSFAADAGFAAVSVGCEGMADRIAELVSSSRDFREKASGLLLRREVCRIAAEEEYFFGSPPVK